MAVIDTTLLGPRDAVHPDDVAGLERWVSAQQAQLRLLHRQLAAALDARRVATERIAAGDEVRRADLEWQVRAMVAAQTQRLAAELQMARAAATARRAQAVHEATVLLAATGAEAEVIRRIVGGPTPPAESPQVGPDAVVDLTEDELAGSSDDRPDTRISAPADDQAEPVALVEGPPADWSDDDVVRHWEDPDPEPAAPEEPEGWPTDLGGGLDARLGGAAAGATVLAGVGLGDLEARAFNQFWGAVPGEGPERSRLRRLVQWVEQR